MAISNKIVDEILVKCARHCCICRRFRPLQLQIHHLLEKGEGGDDNPDNLIPICTYCHSDVHTITKLTRRFSIEELKMHRNSVYNLVSKGHLPSSDSLISTHELDYIVDNVVERINSKSSTQFSKESLLILYACVAEESDIEVRKSLFYPELTPVPNRVTINVGNQSFSSMTDEHDIPYLLNSLLKGKMIAQHEEGYFKITFKGIKLIEEQFPAHGRYSLIKCICDNCGLHFIICTWYPEKHSADKITCPECGLKNGNFGCYRENKLGFIFQLVPGRSYGNS